MQASQRLDRFGAEVFASLNNKLLALKAQGKTIYNMSVGTPDFKPYDHVVEALTQAAQNPEMWKYSLRDLPELKQAVCDYYERRFGVSGITPSMVQSCNGTQEGVGHLGLALLDPGDTILVPDPCYPVFEAGAKIADAKLEYYPLVAEHNYLPYVAGIDPEVADRAKYMIVSLPANPVGSVGTPEVYEEIIAFAREHDLLIVHDNAWNSARVPSRLTSPVRASAFWSAVRMWSLPLPSCAARSTLACSSRFRRPPSPASMVRAMRSRRNV